MSGVRVRVYLSSTFEDLEHYRSAVFAGLEKAGLDVARMEGYTAADERPLALCLNDVARCDVYVGVFGWRYGYTPPSDHGNPNGKSITELEYRRAEDRGIKKLLFLAHPDTKSHWPPQFIDDVRHSDGQRVEALRKEFSTNRTVDFFRTPDELATLVLAAILRTGVSGRPYTVPPRPAGFVARPALTKEVVDSTLSAVGRDNHLLVVHGPSGFGKTALVIDACHTPTLVNGFPDGIFWLTLGEEPDVTRTLADLYVTTTRTPSAAVGVDAIAQMLRNILKGRRCLIVIDDAWRADDLANFFQLDGPTLLVTTPIRNLFATYPGSHPISVEQMDPEEAAALLGRGFETDATTRDSLRRLAEQLGCFPLLLDLANARLMEEYKERQSLTAAIAHVTAIFHGRGVLAFDRRDSNARNTAVERSVAIGLEFGDELFPGLASRAAESSLFPEHVPIPTRVLSDLWGVTEFDAEEETIRTLHNLNLWKWDRAAGTIRLHDMIRLALKARMSKTVDVHRRLLDVWGDPRHLPYDYAWRWFGWHCIEAEQSMRLLRLLLDFEWLAAKLRATDINALIREFDLLERVAHKYRPATAAIDNGFADHMEDAMCVRRLLRRAAHILSRRPDLLAQQLIGRVTRESAPLQKLVADARLKVPRNILVPRTASLAMGGSIIGEIVRHAGAVQKLTLVDGNHVVTGGADGRVWCAQLNGDDPKLLARHEVTASLFQGGVRDVRLTNDGRVVTGGSDGRVYCARLEGGAPVTIVRHDGEVSELALTNDLRVVSTGIDGRVYISRLDGGQPVLLVRHKGHVWQMVLTGDRRVVTGGDDGNVYCSGLAARRT